jgi:hypothetical protein
LEAQLANANAKFEKVVQELSSMKIQVELDSKASEVRISHLLEEAAAQRARAEDLSKSNLSVKARLR